MKARYYLFAILVLIAGFGFWHNNCYFATRELHFDESRRASKCLEKNGYTIHSFRTALISCESESNPMHCRTNVLSFFMSFAGSKSASFEDYCFEPFKKEKCFPVLDSMIKGRR